MLDLFVVVSKGGIVLWRKQFAASGAAAVDATVNAAIKDYIIASRRTGIATTDLDDAAFIASNKVKWAFDNTYGLIFLLVHQKALQLHYVDDFIVAARDLFLSQCAKQLRIAFPAQSATQNAADVPVTPKWPSFESFEDVFLELLQSFENNAAAESKRSAPRRFEETNKFATTAEGVKTHPAGVKPQHQIPAPPSPKLLDTPRSPTGKKSPRVSKTTKSPVPPSKPGFVRGQRKWDGSITEAEARTLDYSTPAGDQEGAVEASDLVNEDDLGEITKDGLYDAREMDEPDREPTPDAEELDEESEYDYVDTPPSKTTSSTGILSYFSNMLTRKPLMDADLDPVLAKMSEHLISKNVASDAAQHLSTTIRSALIGTTLPSSFSSLASVVRTQTETAVKRILTPTTSLDVLRDILAVREKRPYSIVFVGVNGVGKSTNLSKVAFWLLMNKLRVLVAACDTFRSGAVEQLRVHVRNLRAVAEQQMRGAAGGLGAGAVELYEKGYGKDSAAIAKEAIAYAAANRFDVVLVDTAGRMQDNEPLMRALAKLVTVNNPDKIIFVGEALVGNEALNQLSKFNAALKDYSGLDQPRQIDGIILSKFDTVDDKVGAALSMTYITGQPILFVGTGQTYTDLRKMNVPSIVRTLLA
ncbi:SRP54-type protein [Cladochytrium replicatum]|nr:SRP54-type protein [Cladochytrium replicatum]